MKKEKISREALIKQLEVLGADAKAAQAFGDRELRGLMPVTVPLGLLDEILALLVELDRLPTKSPPSDLIEYARRIADAIDTGLTLGQGIAAVEKRRPLRGNDVRSLRVMVNDLRKERKKLVALTDVQAAEQ